MGVFDREIVFHDKPNGGYYCNVCKRYLHPDMVPNHRHVPMPVKPQNNVDELVELYSKPHSVWWWMWRYITKGFDDV